MIVQLAGQDKAVLTTLANEGPKTLKALGATWPQISALSREGFVTHSGAVRTARRGRPPYLFEVTGKGRELLNGGGMRAISRPHPEAKTDTRPSSDDVPALENKRHEKKADEHRPVNASQLLELVAAFARHASPGDKLTVGSIAVEQVAA